MAVDKIVEEYIRAHPGSQKLHEWAEKVFAANGATHASRILLILPSCQHNRQGSGGSRPTRTAPSGNI